MTTSEEPPKATSDWSGLRSLANQLGKPVYEANKLLRAHKDTFPKYWEWNQRILDTGFAEGRLETVFGWSRAVLGDSKPASVGNFPVQGNGAEMLRIAIGLMQNQGIKVCAPIHDAVLIEGHVNEERECLLIAQKCMQRASQMVLGEMTLTAEPKVVRAPSRLMDEDRGLRFWNEVMSILGRAPYIS